MKEINCRFKYIAYRFIGRNVQKWEKTHTSLKFKSNLCPIIWEMKLTPAPYNVNLVPDKISN